MYKKIFFLFFFLLTLFGYSIYRILFHENVNPDQKGYHIVYIKTGSTYNDILSTLNESNILKNKSTFDWVAQKMNYPNNIKPGKYHLNNHLNNRDLVTILRSGRQIPIKLTLSNIFRLEGVAKKAGNIIEADSVEIIHLLRSDSYLMGLNLDSLSIISNLIPNTYELYWNTNADNFIRRMISESEEFWNEERKAKAEKLNLTKHEIVTLASIIQQESNKKDEYNRIAGVYLNRLRDNWPLQADPTLKYAINQPELKRVLNVHKEYDSPYNTYKYIGLPPAPITFPETFSIDAVLNAEIHNYYFFCAKDDFSGYHTFAKTLSEHNRNAALYHSALNKRGIY